MLGLIVENLTEDIAKELNESPHLFDCVFADRVMYPDLKFGTLQIVEAFSFPGDLVSLTLLSSQILRKILCCNNKFYYVKDYDWTRQQNPFHVNELYTTFRNPDLNIVPQNEEIAQFLRDTFQTEINYVCNNYQELFLAIRQRAA